MKKQKELNLRDGVRLENCEITGTQLGPGDSPCFTFWLTLEGPGWGCGFGGVALDEWSDDSQKRVIHGGCMTVISEIMDVVGVRKWEDLRGKHIRCYHDGPGGQIKIIGNLMKDNWLDLDEYFAEYRIARKQ